MNIALVDLPHLRSQLFPFTLTRPIGQFLVGMMTIQDKWTHHLGKDVDLLTGHQLIDQKFKQHDHSYQLIINSAILPDETIIEAIKALKENHSLYQKDQFIAAKTTISSWPTELNELDRVEYAEPISSLNRPWDIFTQNNTELNKDFKLLTANKVSQAIEDPHTVVYGAENIFIAKGVKIKASIINAESGPVYLDENSEIQEGCVIKGPFYLGKHSKVNAGAVIRESCSIGPSCKIGGEVSNSILFANSNKGHDGFLGNSVLGEFCNLGAATNNSNLKNNYATVKMYDKANENFIDSELQFCGLMMGDHSKSAIGTTFNTGTTVGAHSNVFGSGFPPTYIPSFAWGGHDNSDTYQLDKAMITAEKVMARRDVALTETDKQLFQSIFDD